MLWFCSFLEIPNDYFPCHQPYRSDRNSEGIPDFVQPCIDEVQLTTPQFERKMDCITGRVVLNRVMSSLTGKIEVTAWSIPYTSLPESTNGLNPMRWRPTVQMRPLTKCWTAFPTIAFLWNATTLQNIYENHLPACPGDGRQTGCTQGHTLQLRLLPIPSPPWWWQVHWRSLVDDTLWTLGTRQVPL